MQTTPAAAFALCTASFGLFTASIARAQYFDTKIYNEESNAYNHPTFDTSLLSCYGSENVYLEGPHNINTEDLDVYPYYAGLANVTGPESPDCGKCLELKGLNLLGGGTSTVHVTVVTGAQYPARHGVVVPAVVLDKLSFHEYPRDERWVSVRAVDPKFCAGGFGWKRGVVAERHEAGIVTGREDEKVVEKRVPLGEPGYLA